ncbi:MAG: SOS response-associated peptidase [Bradyrhizobiaceae bacterium]|nr:SOS response-associated peptidase [Bradyrhizobiaceae bacterium]
MCGRFTQRYTWRDVHELYGLPGAARNLQAHYNIAPTDAVDAVIAGDGQTGLVSMRWGLVPSWWKKSLKDLPATFNARAETVADKPMFRDAFQRRRCIIPASGYYEWCKTGHGKQPWYISAADGGVLSFAGLWDMWTNPQTGEPLRSCTIIVTAANALTRAVHDRMPVLLEPADFLDWLGGTGGPSLLRPAAEHRLRMWPVSQRVNRTGTGDDDPTLIDEVAVTGEPQSGGLLL